MTLSRTIARPMLASLFVLGGVNGLRNAPAMAGAAKPVTDRIVPLARKVSVPLPRDEVTLVRINAGVQVAAGLTLATGRFPRFSALALAASLIPTTVAGHAFWAESDKAARQQQLLQFTKNLSVLGGLLIAAGDTDGKPGVAWRTSRAAKDARRSAAQLAKSARREAKLAKANLT